MNELLIIAFLIIAAAVIFLVLIQQGKGAGMGASFGAGASATLFGSSGAGNFLTRMTGILMALFFVICLTMANLSSRTGADSGKWSDLSQSMPEKAPAVTSQSDVPVSQGQPAPVETVPNRQKSSSDVPN